MIRGCALFFVGVFNLADLEGARRWWGQVLAMIVGVAPKAHLRGMTRNWSVNL